MRILLTMLLACAGAPSSAAPTDEVPQLAEPVPEGRAEAVLAGGCFWCMESAFEKLDGVDDAVSGYIGGHMANPTYYAVGSGLTGHTEAIRVIYDPTKVTYAQLLDLFWVNIDPTQANGQFCDKGSQYRSALFPRNDAEKALAEQTKAQAEATLGQKVVTTIEPWADFYVAETYHQDFYKKNPAHYQRYRLGCGRDARLAELWGDAASH